ncbi:MAG: hypothetical protein MR051_09635 [Lentisphaeria bacterium]|nr:hypothetical protein [Lentisphaeria bacterium]
MSASFPSRLTPSPAAKQSPNLYCASASPRSAFCRNSTIFGGTCSAAAAKTAAPPNIAHNTAAAHRFIIIAPVSFP